MEGKWEKRVNPPSFAGWGGGEALQRGRLEEGLRWADGRDLGTLGARGASGGNAQM